MSFLCKMNLHKWTYYGKETYETPQLGLMGIPYSYKYRRCNRCNIEQYQHVHCLGANPHKYHRHWETLGYD